VYEPLSNGAYFLGELSKFVHASPQVFTLNKILPFCVDSLSDSLLQLYEFLKLIPAVDP